MSRYLPCLAGGFVLCALPIVMPVMAADDCEPLVGHIVAVEGMVEVQRTDSSRWQTANLDDVLCEGDTVRSGARSRAALALINEAVLRLDQLTTLRLVDIVPEEEEQSILEHIKGLFSSFSRQPRTMAINTAYLNGAIEGTEFVVQTDDQRSTITVLEGIVQASNDFGSVAVAQGEAASAGEGTAPVSRTVVRPRDAVQWSLYYPPILAFLGGASDRVPEDVPAHLRPAARAAAIGDLGAAYAELERIPEADRGARFHLYRAALGLSVGRVQEARSDIDQAVRLDADAGLAYSLRSIIEIVQNETEAALTSARRGVELSDDTAAAWIALSYAQQARFNLEGARASLEKAVQVEPENALAWARLAELRSSFGRLDESRIAAEKAVALEPALSRTQTVLGFAYLTEVKTGQAKDAFQNAIELDQSDPLPRLGLGLARIREGDLLEGRREIDVAVSLDPNNSIVRSYLGKAYYEEKRMPLAETQYGIAKELDPNDPTPWFYDAIAEQTTNRPVEALHSLEESIELNDNRAVYRSRLLLDSDLAARSASIGRIYTDLGFQELALREGWKSVNTDPSNFSAHRLLADSYAALPRHEIARVSELLQSQLLQPLNMTPIQPQLGESNLLLISAGGPGSLSFNEFNPIFNRNGTTFQGTGLVGGNSTSGEEATVSGIYENIAFSLGGFHFETDGFRDNNDQNDDIANAFVQLELSPQTSIQAEYRYRKTDYGDLLLRFFPEDFFPGQRNMEETDTFRLGAKHAFSPESILLGSFTYQVDDFKQIDDQFPAPGVLLVDLEIPDQHATGSELQHIFRSQDVSLTSGAGYFDVDGQLDQNLRFGPPLTPGFIVDVPGSTDLITHHTNLYSYAHVDPIENATVTLGASYDDITGDFPGDEKDQFNPKFGLIWEPVSGTTIRTAAFRTLKRTLVTNQTLEPTQVAGFNQFFDDPNLTETWRYGGAIDQQFTKNLFGGVEFSKRDLKVPFLDFSVDPENPPTRDADWEEHLGRAYLFWTPHEWLALRAEYQYEELKRDEEFPEGVTNADTHRVPLGVNFFHPSGLGASVTATYFNQDGEFGGGDIGPIRKGKDDFWTIDAAVNYRLPNRNGFVTVGATNLLDEEFNYFDPDLNNASIQPDRMWFARVTITFP